MFCLEAPEAVPVPRSLLRADGAASTSGTAACGTPPARSWPWRNASSRKPVQMAAPRLTRAALREDSAPTWRGSRTRWPDTRKKFKIIIPNVRS